MLDKLHGVAARIRGDRSRHRWFWGRVEPFGQAVFARLTEKKGLLTHLNEDVFRLTYAYGSRFDLQGRNGYEPSLYREFTQRIREGMHVFDIGAHIGIFTLAAAKRVGRNGRVYAFEPSPQSADVLERHIALNRFQDRAEVVRAVASDVAGLVPFYVRGRDMSASLGRANVEMSFIDELSTEKSPIPAQKIEVPAVTLDRFCNERGIAPDLLKIDAEGAELLILRGAKNLLLAKPLPILCEIHPVSMETCGASLPELHRYLGSIGYQVQPLSEPKRLGIFHSLITRVE